VKTRLAEPAQEQARKMNAWWRKHRPDARGLFGEELRDVQRCLAAKPDLGQPYVVRGGIIVRRLLMEKTRNHAYYEVREAERVVMIVALWGAVKGTGPDLGTE
jgi:plasmid stabilization system protein ParE